LSAGGSALELWGGVECTINRVGDAYYDQLALSGHRERAKEDLDLFADLGLRTLRTAVHWERSEKQSCNASHGVLEIMNRMGFHPIVGLLHHGSGPRSTNLLDPEFPEKFAAFSLQVALRHPWVVDYTPINEPQTTGRFACLYGHWFPHHRAMRSYIRALFHQMKGIVLAMEAIRSVQPSARLIHTEDGGAVFSTVGLESFRIEREHRRWLGLDLLCGRLTSHHPLFDFLALHGLQKQEILWFTERPCPPSIIGLNYYVTSDRFLDDRLSLYPDHLRGGDSGDEPLVDVEAVRVRPQGIAGAKQVLTDAWNRYRLPVAITEAHLGSVPEEQGRWLAEIWNQAEDARAEGVDVRAVTAWGLLGLYNWCHLCTRDTGAYEPGVFNMSTGRPVGTSLTQVVQQLASGMSSRQPALQSSGWWRQDSRLTIPPPDTLVDLDNGAFPRKRHQHQETDPFQE
jgi:dTDP-4-dehydrorhamnose reductase